MLKSRSPRSLAIYSVLDTTSRPKHGGLACRRGISFCTQTTKQSGKSVPIIKRSLQSSCRAVFDLISDSDESVYYAFFAESYLFSCIREPTLVAKNSAATPVGYRPPIFPPSRGQTTAGTDPTRVGLSNLRLDRFFVLGLFGWSFPSFACCDLSDYDGGDCCECTCDPTKADHDDGCGPWNGFSCIDPMAPCVNDDSVTIDMAGNCRTNDMGETDALSRQPWPTYQMSIPLCDPSRRSSETIPERYSWVPLYRVNVCRLSGLQWCHVAVAAFLL